MTFVDTITAIATPPGEGGIAVVRLSGSEAISIADQIFSGPVNQFSTHTVHWGRILENQNYLIDEVLLVIMKSPHSFTGEDVIEIHCHGSTFIARKIVQLLVSNGARHAEAGEFSFRAFRNGKLDLAQAEAIQLAISAKNELALKAAEHQLAGQLSSQIRFLQKQITDVAAILEAWVDYPEEGLEFATKEEIEDEVTKISASLHALRNSFYDGQRLTTNISLCLIGRPNVGKSSLMNALLGKDRAIVTPISGTTRDLLCEEMHIGSLFFTLTDTAGIRQTEDIIESAGIHRARKAASDADIVLLVLDASTGITEDDELLLSSVNKNNTLIVWNKIDCTDSVPLLDFPYLAKTSALEHRGIDTIKNQLHDMLWQGKSPDKSGIIITQERHFHALQKTLTLIEKALDGMKLETSPELIAYDLRASLHSLKEIIGTNVAEDILSSIFANFCVGK